MPIVLLLIAALSPPSIAAAPSSAPSPAGPSAAHPFPARQQPADVELVGGELLLKLAGPPADRAEAAAAVSGLARRTGLRLEYRRPSVLAWHLVVLAGAGPEETRHAAARLALDRAVVAVVPNVVQRAQRTPNDPLLGELWGLSLVEAEAAWDLTVGARGQRVGVVDSGTSRGHRDLQGRVVRGFDFIRDARRAQDGDGRDADDADDSGGTTHFHGTHVAGTILARADDGFGVPGLNWHAGLVSARALGRGGQGDLVDILEGAAWMAGMSVDDVPPVGADRVSVINLSLGSRGRCSEIERDVYGEILARGVVLVAAAGNTGNETAVGAPANCPGVIAVGAVDSAGALASYSAFSSRLDVMAPGGADSDDVADWILSVDGGDLEGHRWLFGTSMAAPHVTGVVSLMQAVAPDLEPAMIRDILQESPWTCEGCDDEALLQADHAVQTAIDREVEQGVEIADEPPEEQAHEAGSPVDETRHQEKKKGGCEAAPATLALALPLLRRRRRQFAGTSTAVRPKA